MIRGECILCFAPDLWSDIWRNRHRLLAIFARENRVLYIEPRNTLRSLARKLRDGDLGWRDFLRPRIEEPRANLFVYHDPLHLPRTTKPLLGPAVERLRAAMLRRALSRLSFSRPILWLVRPEAADLPGTFDEKAVLYQIVDDYLSYPGVQPASRRRLEADERRLASRADVVVVTSESLLEAKRGLNPNMHVVRNAVDDGTLEAGGVQGGPVPPELASLRRPIFGYLGGVTGKLDFELLETVAAKLQSAGTGTLLFVGPVRVTSAEDAARVEKLRAAASVVFAGPKAAQDVPLYLRAMDVCLIPYRAGSQAQAIDPLKLYEYLAFGKPVVAVDIPSVRPFAEVIHVARGREEFIGLLDAAAAERNDEKMARRRALASENTWEARAEAISRLLEETFRRKTAPRPLEEAAASGR
jgi:glycosyltransferase involved in cell wall biosynthesis